MQISTISPSTFDDGKPVTLTGSGFGASQGQVLIGGVAQNVNTWSDTSITFTTVRGSQSLGACRVDVVGGVGSASTTMRSSVTQHGITWTFDTTYPVGQYINGDYFVVGPVVVTQISLGVLNNAALSGSMVNPAQTTTTQGITSSQASYSDAKNIATALPYTLAVGESLVSTHGKTAGTASSGPGGANNRSSVDKASVLTCVQSPPLAQAFRPPYAGTSKPTYAWNKNILDSWPTVNASGFVGFGSTASLIDSVARLWMDIKVDNSGITNDRLHPQANMFNYNPHAGRQYASAVLATFLNTVSAQDRETLVIYLTQIGIDTYHNYLLGMGGLGNAGGSIGVGRKLPVLFAGYALNNLTILNAWVDSVFTNEFMEDVQLQAVTESLRENINRDPWLGTDPNQYYWPGIYDAVPDGSPVWTERNPPVVAAVGHPGKMDYQEVSNMVYTGLLMAAQLLGIESKLNNSLFIDYVDNVYSGLLTTWGVTGYTANNGAGDVVGPPLNQTPLSHQDFYTAYRV